MRPFASLSHITRVHRATNAHDDNGALCVHLSKHARDSERSGVTETIGMSGGKGFNKLEMLPSKNSTDPLFLFRLAKIYAYPTRNYNRTLSMAIRFSILGHTWVLAFIRGTQEEYESNA